MSPQIATIKRLLKPLVLVGPLALLILVPAVFYGRQSSQAADEANNALLAATTNSDDGVSLAAMDRCPQAADNLTVEFAELGFNEESHKASVSGFGFSSVVVDLRGWRSAADAQANSNHNDSTQTAVDVRDDVTVHLRKVDDQWCLNDVDVYGADNGDG